MNPNTETGKEVQAAQESKIAFRPVHRLRILFVAVLVILTAQGWFGDTTNLFVKTSSASQIPFTLGAIITRIETYGPILIWHATEGLILLILSLITIALAFAWSNKLSVRIMSILGSAMVISAVVGGLSFVVSGFTAAGSSAQMGGSFIGAFAFYFMALYFTK
jgi:hypothetical protein